MPEEVLLVEGASDRAALLTVAGVLGRDLAGVEIVAMGGITNLRKHLAAVVPGARLAVLHDARETPYVDRTLAGHDGRVARFVCEADLEDELVRALGLPAVLEIVEAAGDLAAWRTLCNQPFHRERDRRAVLRRFFGTTSGRKHKYAALLAAALDPDRVPAPLRGALEGR